MDASTLKAGTTQTLTANPQQKSQTGQVSQVSNMKGGPTINRTRMGGGPTQLTGGNPGNKRQKSKMKTTSSERDNEYVKEGTKYVTPKKLITAKIDEMYKQYTKSQQDEAEQQKKATQINRESSMMESSQMQSAEKSSGSDNKMNSSGIKDSSFMNSKKSDNTESDSEQSKIKSEQGGEDAKNKKKTKTLTDQEKDENIIINLSETETQILLHIPSSLIASDNPKFEKVQTRNQKYENFLKDRIGSDNYTNRPAQTFNYAPKFKEQQSTRVDKVDSGAYATLWDLHDAALQDQLNEYEILQEEIKKSIDKELTQKLKNPFCLLSTDVRAINIHSRQEIPGEALIQAVKGNKGTRQVGGGTYAGQTQLGAPTQMAVQNTQQQQQQAPNDDTNKDSSNQLAEISGTKQTKKPDNQSISKTYGKPANEQLLRERKLALEQLDQEEEQMIKEAVELAKKQPSDEEVKVMHSDALSTYLKYVDRILNQNTYHKQYILYRNYPEVKIEKMHIEEDQSKRTLGNFRMRAAKKNEEEQQDDVKKQETLSPLFKFACDISKDRTVSYADWNPVNQDLLAVSYGELDLNVNQDGMIMFWTLKNPSFPERIIKYPSRITTCKFSQRDPNLLACGTYDGIVAIFDIRKKDGKPVAENKEMNGKHSDAIWEVHWVGKGGKSADKGVEGLISISSDGRIAEWSMKKGLEYTDLMNLKRSTHPSNKEASNEGINFRQAAGFSLDFLKGESSMYLAATEDGAIHRCSKSYSEQYLDSYFGHTGPVYRVRCNPFWSDIFLSCSADWSCKLWNWKFDNYISNFQSLDLFDEVMDIEWSPQCSTLFASVCKDGRLELWDLEKNNMLDPFAYIKPKDQEYLPSKTMVRFCEGAPIIITGDIAGDCSVYRMHGYEDQDPKDQRDKLEKLLYPTGYNTKGGKDKVDEEM